MKFKLKALLEKLVDPRGPVGNFASPSEVFKERLGLPISSPHTLRMQATKAPAFAEHAVAPARVVDAKDAVVPKNRVRMASAYIEEHWEPIYAKPVSTNITECLRAANTPVAWRVTQKVRSAHCDCARAKYELHDGALIHTSCGRAAPAKATTDAEIVEVVQSLQLSKLADDDYNVFMPTVPGPDAIMTPAGLAKGGTRIGGGRREYREKTAGFAHWDSGTLKERERAQHGAKVEMQQKLERHTDSALKAMPTKMVFKAKSVARERAQGTKP